MKKSYRMTSLVSAILLCISLLCACGASDKNVETTAVTETQPVTEASVPTETSAPQTEAPTQEPTQESTEAPIPSSADAQEPSITLPDDFPMELNYSSGAGGWFSSVTLQPDGSFTGTYHDSEMGEMSEEYPQGTIYYCNFEGKFTEIHMVDDTTYGMILESLTLQDPEGKEVIEDGFRHVAAGALGIQGGSEFYLYSPVTPIDVLTENASFSWPGNYLTDIPETLTCWALYNQTEDSTFFSAMSE